MKLHYPVDRLTTAGHRLRFAPGDRVLVTSYISIDVITGSRGTILDVSPSVINGSIHDLYSVAVDGRDYDPGTGSLIWGSCMRPLSPLEQLAEGAE